MSRNGHSKHNTVKIIQPQHVRWWKLKIQCKVPTHLHLELHTQIVISTSTIIANLHPQRREFLVGVHEYKIKTIKWRQAPDQTLGKYQPNYQLSWIVPTVYLLIHYLQTRRASVWHPVHDQNPNNHQMSGDPESTVLKNLTVIFWEKNYTLLHLSYVFELVYGK